MAKPFVTYRKRVQSRVVAAQWIRNGDHPEDGDDPHVEGLVVRYFRHPAYEGGAIHGQCGCAWHDHGWIDAARTHVVSTARAQGGLIVCPGNMVVASIDDLAGEVTYEHLARRPAVVIAKGEYFVMSEKDFNAAFEVDEPRAFVGCP